jgi:hypothetical protein
MMISMSQTPPLSTDERLARYAAQAGKPAVTYRMTPAQARRLRHKARHSPHAPSKRPEAAPRRLFPSHSLYESTEGRAAAIALAERQRDELASRMSPGARFRQIALLRGRKNGKGRSGRGRKQ